MMRFLVNKEKLATIIYYVLAALSIYFFGQIADRSDRRPRPGQPPMSLLIAELQGVPVVPGSSASRDLTTSDRGGMVMASRHFSVGVSPGDVVSYYRAGLLLRGWKVSDASRSGLMQPSISFCKSNISLTLEASGAEHSSMYGIYLGWTNDKGMPAYCGAL
jgi:hypothetical protein